MMVTAILKMSQGTFSDHKMWWLQIFRNALIPNFTVCNWPIELNKLIWMKHLIICTDSRQWINFYNLEVVITVRNESMHLSAIQEFDDRELLDIALTFYEVIQKLFFLGGKN